MLVMDLRSRAVNPTVVCCLYQEDLNRSLLVFLCGLFLFSMKQTWEFQDLWEHHTKLIEMKDVAHSFYYIYSVCWNIQTANTPMALGSASAYFTIKVNKNKTPVSCSFSSLFPLMRLQ